MNRAAIILALTDGPPVEFVSTASTGSSGASSATVTKPSGVAVGDLVLVLVDDTETAVTLTTTSGSAWGKFFQAVSGINSDGHAVFWKILNATDVANAWTLSYGGQGATAFRYLSHEATSVSLKDSATASGAGSLSLTGFSKAAGNYGVLTFAINTHATAPTVPTGFVSRYSATPVSSRVVAADMLTGYVDGAAVAWTGFVSGERGGFLLEVTGP